MALPRHVRAKLEEIRDADMRERLQYLRKEEVFRNMHLETREEEIARKLEEQRKAMEAERAIAIVKQMEADRAEKEKALDDAKTAFESEKEKALDDAKAEKERALEEQRVESVRQMLRHGITPEKVAEILNVPLEDVLDIGKRKGAIED